MKISNDELYNLVRKLSELNASELTVKNEDLVIKIKHDGSANNTNYITPTRQIVETQSEDDSLNETENKPGKAIAAPINGTFYSAPGPEEPAYVKAGDRVKKGEPVCILEAMKMMNTINMPEDGVILSIEVSNEDVVDTGQALVFYDSI